MEIGSRYRGNKQCDFTVWAPEAGKVELKLHNREKKLTMEKDAEGYWRISLENVPPGTKYTYVIDGKKERPDPASHSQPDGVHEPSQVIDHGSFQWGDKSWQGIPLEEMIIYELHIGTFTGEGTFESGISRLDELEDLGINVVNVMPVAQFPGERNWGYDGTYPFAPQNSYGGPEGLKKFVDACHNRGIAVVLDVVYNHLGPEGNYLWDYGPYFTNRYRTLWGEAINFDGPYSDHVRNYFIQNALYWFQHYHIDSLRLDAVHAIYDNSAKPFLRELAEKVKEFSMEQGREYYLMPESNLNDTRIIREWEYGGFGHHTQWLDDFHHAVHTLLTGEDDGYYVDFGSIDNLVKALTKGYVYDWKYSEFRKRRHGNSSEGRPAEQFIVCIQNHDQIGNRMNGERLEQLVPFEAAKLAAAILLLGPNIPMLFMGEEYGETSPFLYFVSHNDPDLIEAVREGRKKEFSTFDWDGEPPDPQAVDTFLKSKLHWDLKTEHTHATLYKWYKQLVQMRKEIPALQYPDKEHLLINKINHNRGFTLYRLHDSSEIFGIFNFSEDVLDATIPFPDGTWERILNSSEDKWDGPGMKAFETVEGQLEIDIHSYNVILYRRKS